MTRWRFWIALAFLLLTPAACAFLSPVVTITSEEAQEAVTVQTQVAAAWESTATLEAPLSYEPPQTVTVLQDDFGDPNSGWDIMDVADGSVGYGDGYYSVSEIGGESLIAGAAGVDFSDAVIEVDAARVRGPANLNDAYGLFCRLSSDGTSSNGYLALVSGDGYYSIMIEVDGEYEEMIPWAQSDVILQGDAANHLALACINDEITLYVNGEYLVSVVDHTFSEGDIALAAISFEKDLTEIHFSNFRVGIP